MQKETEVKVRKQQQKEQEDRKAAAIAFNAAQPNVWNID